MMSGSRTVGVIWFYLFVFKVFSLVLYAGDIVTESEKLSFEKNWTFSGKKQDLKPGRIESFENMPETLHFLTGKGKAQFIRRGVTVKPMTWYEVTLLYKNISAMSENQQKPPFEFYLGAKDSAEKSFWKCISRITIGAAGTWVRPKLYFNSGKREQVDLVMMFFGSENWSFGRISMSEVTAQSDRSSVVLDGDSEQSSVGSQACDFSRRGSNYIRPQVMTAEDAPSGRQIISSELKPGLRAQLHVNPFLLAKGDKIRVSIWLKADSPVTTQLLVSSDYKFKHRVRAVVDNQWKLLDIETVVGASLPNYFLAEFDLFLKSPTKNRIYIDNLSVTVIPKLRQVTNDSKNYIRYNPSFETGTEGWSYSFQETPQEHQTGGSVALDTTNAVHGQSCLKINKPASTMKTRKNVFSMRYMLAGIRSGKHYTLSFRAKADRNTSITAAIPYGRIGDFAISTAWKQYSATVLCRKNWYGSDSSSLTFSSPLDGTTLWIDEVQLEEGEKSTSFSYPTPFAMGIDLYKDRYKIYDFNAPIEARLLLVSHRLEKTEAIYGLTVKDYRGNVVFHKKQNVALKPEQPLKFEVNLPSDRFGWFVVETKLEDKGGKKLADAATTYAVVPAPKNLSPDKSEFGLYGGCAISLREGGSGSLGLTGGSYSERIDVYKKLGFKWLRLQMPGCWKNIEGEKGKPNWTIYDTMIDTIKKQNMNILVDFMSQGRPDWAAIDNSPKNKFGPVVKLDAAAEFAKQFATHYKKKIDAVQLMNETGGYSPKDYYELAKTVAPVFKRYAPEISRNMPSYPSNCLPWPDGPDDTWINQVFKLGVTNYADVIDFHPYTHGHSHGQVSELCKMPDEANLVGRWGTKPEQLELQIKKFREQYGNLPLWSTESGFTFNTNAPWQNTSRESRLDWYTPEIAAGRMVRWGIILKGLEVKRQIYFMFAFDLPYHGLDMMNVDMTPRAGVPGFAAFASLLDGTALYRKFTLGVDTPVYIFTESGKTIATYWNYNMENKKSGTLKLSALQAPYKSYDFMGNPQKRADGILELSSSPAYFVTEAYPERVEAAFKNAVVSGTLEAELRVGFGNDSSGSPAIFCGIKNLRNQSLKGKVVKLQSTGAFAIQDERKITEILPSKNRLFSIKTSLINTSFLQVSAAMEGGNAEPVQFDRPVACFRKIRHKLNQQRQWPGIGHFCGSQDWFSTLRQMTASEQTVSKRQKSRIYELFMLTFQNRGVLCGSEIN
jgi:predicted porin